VEAIIEKRRGHRVLSRRLPSVPTKVSVDNRASEHFSVIDVRAQDRVGLLYAIASQLTAMGLEIALAKIATEAHRAIDSFYVTKDGQKLADPEQMESALGSLRGAIDNLAGASALA
jgi:[protein-PII] uridylyltransferase